MFDIDQIKRTTFILKLSLTKPKNNHFQKNNAQHYV